MCLKSDIERDGEINLSWHNSIPSATKLEILADKLREGVHITNILEAAFLYVSVIRIFSILTVCVRIFLAKGIGEKATRKMLVKLTKDWFTGIMSVMVKCYVKTKMLDQVKWMLSNGTAKLWED